MCLFYCRATKKTKHTCYFKSLRQERQAIQQRSLTSPSSDTMTHNRFHLPLEVTWLHTRYEDPKWRLVGECFPRRAEPRSPWTNCLPTPSPKRPETDNCVCVCVCVLLSRCLWTCPPLTGNEGIICSVNHNRGVCVCVCVCETRPLFTISGRTSESPSLLPSVPPSHTYLIMRSCHSNLPGDALIATRRRGYGTTRLSRD